MLIFLFPLFPIIASLAWYALRVRSRIASLAAAAVLLGGTAFLTVAAGSVLPRYDGDGLWPMWTWFGVIFTFGTVFTAWGLQAASTRVGAIRE